MFSETMGARSAVRVAVDLHVRQSPNVFIKERASAVSFAPAFPRPVSEAIALRHTARQDPAHSASRLPERWASVRDAVHQSCVRRCRPLQGADLTARARTYSPPVPCGPSSALCPVKQSTSDPQRLHVNGHGTRCLGGIHDKQQAVPLRKSGANARSVRLPVTLEAPVTTTRWCLGGPAIPVHHIAAVRALHARKTELHPLFPQPVERPQNRIMLTDRGDDMIPRCKKTRRWPCSAPRSHWPQRQCRPGLGRGKALPALPGA